MKHFLHYDDNGQEVEVPNPSARFVSECIEKLDNASRTSIGLTLNSLDIIIGGGNKGRVLVIVVDSANTRCLVDPTVGDSQEIPIWLGGQCAYEPLNQTVPIPKAVDVVLYCFENHKVPDGLEWAQR